MAEDSPKDWGHEYATTESHAAQAISACKSRVAKVRKVPTQTGPLVGFARENRTAGLPDRCGCLFPELAANCLPLAGRGASAPYTSRMKSTFRAVLTSLLHFQREDG